MQGNQIVKATIATAALMTSLVAGDACTDLTYNPNVGAYVGTVSDIRDCLDDTPFNSNVRDATIAALRDVAEAYSYTTLQKGRIPPYNQEVDLPALLDTIEITNYSSDFAFHRAINEAFASLNDAHTTYSMPDPYSQMVVLLPFQFSVSSNGSSMTFNSGASTQVFGSTVPGILDGNANAYAGSENKVVTSIDGNSPQDQFIEWARQQAFSLSESVRFNALVMYDMPYISLSEIPLPSSDTVSLDFSDGSSGNFKYMIVGFASTKFANGADVVDRTLSAVKRNIRDMFVSIDRNGNEMRLRMLAGNPFKTRKAQLQAWVKNAQWDQADDDGAVAWAGSGENYGGNPVRVEKLYVQEDQMPKRQSMHLEDQQRENRSRLLTEDYISFRNSKLESIGTDTRRQTNLFRDLGAISEGSWVLYQYGTDTLVLDVAGFSPLTSQSDINTYINEVIGLIEFTVDVGNSDNVPNLIVDVSGNGGGIVCLAKYLSYALNPDWEQDEALETYIIRSTAAARRINNIDGSFAEACSSGSELSFDEWFDNSTSYDFGGTASDTYTTPAYLDECVDFLNIEGLPQSTHHFDNVVIVSDGTCGSACSLFLGQMRRYGRAAVYTYGGILGEPMNSSAFTGGGIIVSWQDAARQYGFTAFPTNVDMSVNHLTLFIGQTEKPFEYELLEGDARGEVYDTTRLMSASNYVSFLENVVTAIDAGQLANFDDDGFFDYCGLSRNLVEPSSVIFGFVADKDIADLQPRTQARSDYASCFESDLASILGVPTDQLDILNIEQAPDGANGVAVTVIIRSVTSDAQAVELATSLQNDLSQLSSGTCTSDVTGGLVMDEESGDFFDSCSDGNGCVGSFEPSSADDDDGVSAGAIAGIVLGCLAAVTLLVLGVMTLRSRRQRKAQAANQTVPRPEDQRWSNTTNGSSPAGATPVGGYAQDSYPPSGYAHDGYPPPGYPPAGYPPQAHPPGDTGMYVDQPPDFTPEAYHQQQQMPTYPQPSYTR
eukprot:Clim_evm3s97 gene=Clim_evmTU3s97